MGVRRPNEALTGDLAACVERSNRGRRLQHELLMTESGGELDLAGPLKDAVGLFNAVAIDYALIGGFAAMYYGRPRFTEDVDFIARSGHEAVLGSQPDQMKQFGFDPSCTWKLYHRSGAEIDIWKDEYVEDMIDRAVQTQMAGTAVRIVEMHDLIAMKLRSGRPQDDYDICEILKHQSIEVSILKPRVTDEQFDSFNQLRHRVSR